MWGRLRVHDFVSLSVSQCASCSKAALQGIITTEERFSPSVTSQNSMRWSSKTRSSGHDAWGIEKGEGGRIRREGDRMGSGAD